MVNQKVRSKSSQLDQDVKLYILNNLGYDRSLEEAKSSFHAEFQHEIDRFGRLTAMTNWLQGLATDLEYRNHEILALAHKWGSLEPDCSEKEEDKILENYWHFMANKLLQLFDGYHVPKEK